MRSPNFAGEDIAEKPIQKSTQQRTARGKVDRSSSYFISRIMRRIVRTLISLQTLLIFALLIASMFVWNMREAFEKESTKSLYSKTGAVEVSRETVEIRYGIACIFAAALVLCNCIISTLIFYSTLYFARNTLSGKEMLLVVHSLSSHISLFLVLAGLWICIVIFKYNVIVRLGLVIDIYLSFSQIVIVSLIATTLFGILHIVVERIRHSFNNENNLNRILTCLYSELALKIIEMGSLGEEHMRVYAKRKATNILPYRESDEIRKNTLFLEGNDVSNTTKKLIFYEFSKNEYFGSYYTEKDLKNPERLRLKIANKLKKRESFLFNGKELDVEKMLCVFSDNNMITMILSKAGIKLGVRFSEKELVLLIAKTLGERVDIERNLKQRYSALKNTEMMSSAIILFFCTASLLLGFKIEDENVFSFVSMVFGAAYFFQPAVTNLIDGLLFLFFIHPFDIGDRVLIKVNETRENMVVLETHMLYTVFQRWDNVKIYVCNMNLYEEDISNLRRGGYILDAHQIQIDHYTDEKDIDEFKTHLEEFLLQNPNDYTGLCLVNYVFIEEADKLHLRVLTQFKESGQDNVRLLQLKSKVLELIISKLHILNITYTLPSRCIKVVQPSVD